MQPNQSIDQIATPYVGASNFTLLTIDKTDKIELLY